MRVSIGRGDPEREAETWAGKLEVCARLSRAYQQQQAAGLMTLEELGSMLKDLEETRRLAEGELASAAAQWDRMEMRERDRDELLGYMSAAVPEGLENLTGEERNRLYRMLRLQVTPSSEGYELKGGFCTTRLPPRSPREPRGDRSIGGDLDPRPFRLSMVSSRLSSGWKVTTGLPRRSRSCTGIQTTATPLSIFASLCYVRRDQATGDALSGNKQTNGTFGESARRSSLPLRRGRPRDSIPGSGS